MAALASLYAASGLAMAGITYELYTNVTYARGMNVRVRRIEVPEDAMLRKIPTDWLTHAGGKVIGTDCWTTAPRNTLKIGNSPIENEELFLLYANALFQSPACSWEIFLTNLKKGKFQWNQPWSELKEGEEIGAYTVTKRTPTEAILQWSGNAVEGQTSISIHPEQPAALFQLGATLFKGDNSSRGADASSASVTKTQMNYLRMVLAQTYTTMERCSKAAHEQQQAKKRELP